MFQIALTEEVAGMAFVFHLGGGEFQIVQYGGGDEIEARDVFKHCSLATMGLSQLGNDSGAGCFVDIDDISLVHTFESDMFDEEGHESRSVHSTFGSTDG